MEKWERYGRQIRGPLSYSTVGLELALSVGLGYWAGDAFDGWMGTPPWGMLAGVLLGVAAGGVTLFRAVKRLKAAEDE